MQYTSLPAGTRREHFLVNGPLTVPRSPQGRSVLFQAGSSEPGRDLAARHAEGIYAVAYDDESATAYSADLRRRARAAGRDGDALVIMPGLVTYVGSTEDAAMRKKAEPDALLPVEHSLAQLSMFVGQDCSDWERDAPVPELPPLSEFTGPQGRYETILRIIDKDSPTVRELLGTLAAGGGHCTMIGTPESIADEIEHWHRVGAADGFNLMPPMYPHGLEEFVDHVIPVLHERGLFWLPYRAPGHCAIWSEGRRLVRCHQRRRGHLRRTRQRSCTLCSDQARLRHGGAASPTSWR